MDACSTAREKALSVLDKAKDYVRTSNIRSLLDLDIYDRRAVGMCVIEQLKEICDIKEDKILLMGIAPSSGRESEGAWTGGPAANKLATLLGLHVPELRAHFKLRNIYKTEVYPRKQREEKILESILDEKFVIILGREAAYCLGLEALPWLVPHDIEMGPTVVVAPHPSGRRRWWNDPENTVRAESFFAGIRVMIGAR